MSAVLVCDGQLTYNSATRPACKYADGTNAWLEAPSESIFIANLFDVPEVSQLQAAFLASFSLIMIVHLSSWAYGKVINFAEDRKT